MQLQTAGVRCSIDILGIMGRGVLPVELVDHSLLCFSSLVNRAGHMWFQHISAVDTNLPGQVVWKPLSLSEDMLTARVLCLFSTRYIAATVSIIFQNSDNFRKVDVVSGHYQMSPQFCSSSVGMCAVRWVCVLKWCQFEIWSRIPDRKHSLTGVCGMHIVLHSSSWMEIAILYLMVTSLDQKWHLLEPCCIWKVCHWDSFRFSKANFSTWHVKLTSLTTAQCSSILCRYHHSTCCNYCKYNQENHSCTSSHSILACFCPCAIFLWRLWGPSKYGAV